MTEKISYTLGYCDQDKIVPVVPEKINDLSKYKRMYEEFDLVRKMPTLNNPDKLVAYANYVPADLRKLIDENPSAKFIRVYVGVEAGFHKTFMVAIDNNENVIPSLVVENCCQCPPRCQPPTGGWS